jgi:hypothetical protein
MSSYCAPCLADLALVRDAVTSVNGTAACVAHAVLLTHPGDNPQRRLQRLSELRSMAEGKLATASAEDVPAIELLVQEYALAGAMDMTVPLRDIAGDRAPRPPKKRRERGRDRERGPREFPVQTRTADDAPSDDAAPTDGAPSEGAPSDGAPSEGAPAEAGPSPDLSGAESAGTSSGPDNSPAPVPSPEPAPHGDGLVAPEGVNSASTTGQDTPDTSPAPTPAEPAGTTGADSE